MTQTADILRKGEIPADIMDEARSIADHISYVSPDPASVREEIALAILAERQRCAEIADRMHIKHGSPVMGPYENGNWDQGKRIAALIRGEA